MEMQSFDADADPRVTYVKWGGERQHPPEENLPISPLSTSATPVEAQ